ncbi:hypothetical protein [Bacillus thuringiensis]|uniref:hypothetical protein n=1 Tax=Bacillus thuringiensis TaxID=1428 RepID=UPI000B192FA6|nr:hypothetical protein [Bacillus thuringiensis]
MQGRITNFQEKLHIGTEVKSKITYWYGELAVLRTKLHIGTEIESNIMENTSF